MLKKNFPVLSENQTQMVARRSINFHKRLQPYELPEQLDRIKRQVVLDLQKKQPAMASDLYRLFSVLLKGTPESKEILQVVKAQHFGDAVIVVQFPGLLESCMINDSTCAGEGARSQEAKFPGMLEDSCMMNDSTCTGKGAISQEAKFPGLLESCMINDSTSAGEPAGLLEESSMMNDSTCAGKVKIS
jgi:hypothetical protein